MAARRKTKPSNIDSRLGALRDDMNALQSDMVGLAHDAGDTASARAREAARAAEGVAQRALRLAEETAMHAVDDVEAWTNDNLESARDTVRAQPIAALFLSLGIGAIFGAFFLRR